MQLVKNAEVDCHSFWNSQHNTATYTFVTVEPGIVITITIIITIADLE